VNFADFPIRSEWMYEVRSACQEFQCAVWLTERAQFEQALRSLVASVPAAMSVQEAAALKELLMTGVVDASRLFHSYSHELSPPRRCRASPVESVQHVWSEWHEDPRLTLACWVERFLAVYDATHPPSPAERASAILRDRFRAPPDLGALATCASCWTDVCRCFLVAARGCSNPRSHRAALIFRLKAEATEKFNVHALGESITPAPESLERSRAESFPAPGNTPSADACSDRGQWTTPDRS
jgi:hypothetical protein